MRKKIQLLDGSLSYPIELRGDNLNTKLWTAKILMDNPKVIEDIHVEYINSGVDYISTSSYQLSVKTLKEEGYNILEIENIFKKSVSELNVARSEQGQDPWKMRIGLNSGAAMAGVVGTNKFVYDIWGDTVNLASRFEQAGQEDKINISESTYYAVRDYFGCEERGK